MNLPANAAGTGLGISMFPDIYQPKYENEQQVVPKDVVSFLSNGDPKAITAYVQAKLGQQVAAQLPAGDSPGFRGAIFNLMAQPQYRKQLIGSPAGQ
jgi:hypothetical protein